jgi:hypothetical protein
MTSGATLGMWFDFAFGAHPHSVQLLTTPILIAGLASAYDAGSQGAGWGVVYLEWLRDTAESTRALVLSMLLLLLYSALAYLVLGARNRWIVIETYRAVRNNTTST